MRQDLDQITSDIRQAQRRLSSYNQRSFRTKSREVKKLKSEIKDLECKFDTEQDKVIIKTMQKFNTPHRLKNTIDLHSLTKPEAMKAFTRWLNSVKADLENKHKYRIRVQVITGKGNNSINGPVLKPAIEDYLDDNDYDYEACPGGGAFTFWVVNHNYDYYSSYSD